MSNTKLFYSYKDTKNTGKVTLDALSSYSDSIIFDEDNRRLWHDGKQYGNTYWGSIHGETFNDLERNYAYNYAHAEGGNSYAGGAYSHVEGKNNTARGEGAHVEGFDNQSLGNYSHVEGYANQIFEGGDCSHVEGYSNVTSGPYSHVEGNTNTANSEGAHIEGTNNTSEETGIYSHIEGNSNIASGEYLHIEGSGNMALGNYSHSEGSINEAIGEFSHVEGSGNAALGDYSHAQGNDTISSGIYSNAQGISTTANGKASNSEGLLSYANGAYSHAEGNSSYTNGAYSHAEGFMTYAIGNGAHAEGKNSYARGNYSHTEGLGTITYNDYEIALGKYNKSISTGDNTTIYSIGDGTSNAKRHNIIDFRKNGDMHKNGNSYFHNDIYGPVSYTYVSSLGETATLDIVLSSLLEQPKYTRPKISVQYKLSTGTFYTVNTNTDYTETVELGTHFIPKFKISWATRTQSNTSGTRAENGEGTPDRPNYLLGYSYGVAPNGISISYNNGGPLGTENTDPNACDKSLTAYTLSYEYNGATSDCYIFGEDSYTLFSNLRVTYLPFSYMYFQQLYDKGVYVHAYGLSPTEWLEGGTSNLGGFKALGRLKYYWGFSGDSMNPNNNHPKDMGALKAQNSGWLFASNTTTEVNVNTGKIGKTNASKYCLWIAYPDSNDSISNAKITNKHYKLVANSNKFDIEVLQQDGMNYNLITPDQPVKSSFLDVRLGNSNYTIRYKIAYIDFQQPIGNENNVLKFSIAPEKNIKPALI